MAKEIRVLTLEVGRLKFGFENPRKISQKKKDELKASLETLLDFGIFLIDENYNVIAARSERRSCKRWTEQESHLQDAHRVYAGRTSSGQHHGTTPRLGEWRLDGLAAWTADLNLVLGIDETKKKAVDERTLKEMELIHYEKYDYVLIACRYETDYLNLIRKLGIEGKRVRVCKKRTIQARAIWYDEIKGRLIVLTDRRMTNEHTFWQPRCREAGA